MAKTTNRIPRLSDDAGYAEATAKRNELKGKLNAAHDELSQMHSTMTQQAKVNPLDREAYREIGIELPAEEIGKSMKEVRERIRVLERAIELQNTVLLREQNRASQATARAQLPAYRDVVERMARILSKLRDVCEEEANLRDELFQADALRQDVIHPMRLQGDILFAIDAFMAEAKEYYGISA